MSITANPPELIISLSHDRVRVQLPAKREAGRAAWTSTFPVKGIFLADQISGALDSALAQNPSLIDQFEDVAILVMDRPNVTIPQCYADQDKLPEIAGRYLKVRAGDTLTADSTSGDIVIAYSLPSGTINVLKEYYAGADQVHLTSVIWSAISQMGILSSKDNPRLFFLTTGNTLIVLGECDGKLTFSRSFFVHDEGDVAYYALACSRMLKPKEHWLLTILNESTLFELPRDSYFTIHHQIELPELHTLIARHRS
jgi:hypothetical protein